MKKEVQAFLVLQGLGGVGHAAMLLTALLSPRVVRSSTWINFSVTWLIYVISYVLLGLAGQESNTDGPGLPLCLTQASLIYGAPVLTACSGLSLIIQVWFSVRAVRSSHDMKRPAIALLLISWPYIPWFFIMLGTFIFGATHPQYVQRASSGIYCTIRTGVPGQISSALVVVVLVAAVSFQGQIIWAIYKDVRVRRAMHEQKQVSRSMVTRLGLFTLWSVVTLIPAAMFISRNFDFTNICLALMPLVAFILFVTQRDMLRVWTFRK